MHFAVHSQINEDTLRSLEQTYGEQWDFCTCVIKNDSIQRGITNPEISEENLNELLERFDFIDQKCKAFQLSYEKQTPEERGTFELKVKECLTEE